MHGCHEETKKKAFTALVRPHLEYCEHQDGCVLRSGTEIASNGQNHTVIADMSLVGKPLCRDEIYSVAVRYTKW